MTIIQKEKDVIEDFSLLQEWDDRYEYLIEFGDKLPNIDAELKIDSNLVKGCQSKVWLVGNVREGKVEYLADGDSPIPKGIAGVLYHIFSGMSAEEVRNHEVRFINEIGLNKFLSPLRLKGANSMIDTFKRLADN